MAHVCIHTGPHDSAVGIVQDDNVMLIIEERLGHRKHACPPVKSVFDISKWCKTIEDISFSNLCYQFTDFGFIKAYLDEISGLQTSTQEISIHADHHLLHARGAFSHSGFDDATVIVIDGAGSLYTYGKENQTIYSVDKKQAPVCTTLEKNIVGLGSSIIDIRDNDIPSWVNLKSNIGAGFVYTAVTEWLGFDGLEAGKTMGLSAYGKYDENIPEIISTEHFGNKSCTLNDLGYSSGVDEKRTAKYGDIRIQAMTPENYLQDKSFTYLFGSCSAKVINLDHIDKSEKDRHNVAWRLQNDYEKYLIHACKRALSMGKSKNLILTGGCALNCVANYKLIKSLPEDINLYVEPVCDDSGVTLGGAYNSYDPHTKVDFKLKTLYLGRPLQYHYELKDNEDEYEASSKDIAKLISNQNIVAIVQGRSEIGPRALGNRSMLFDPRVKDGKDIVNRVKKREYFRPFAGTVLLEHARDWFDMGRLEESPFMMYAVDVLPEKRDLIPSIVHVDGTCRIQTVTRKQNKHYYDLISEFYKLTGVPILFNTSFNLAGDTMVDTIEDGINTLRYSEIKYMYLPEKETLISIPLEYSLNNTNGLFM